MYCCHSLFEEEQHALGSRFPRVYSAITSWLVFLNDQPIFPKKIVFFGASRDGRAPATSSVQPFLWPSVCHRIVNDGKYEVVAKALL